MGEEDEDRGRWGYARGIEQELRWDPPCNESLMIGEPIQRATVSFSRRTGGDVDSKTTAYQLPVETAADSAVHEGGLQAEP